MRIIINADDLGYSQEVNDEIFTLMRRRLVTSATLMANGPALESACRGAQEFPDLSFGVHLVLTEFAPLTSQEALRPLLNEAGEFAGLRRLPASIDREAIFLEFSAQIQKLQDMGIKVSHIDSHHHMHTTPGLFGVIKKLQRRFGIRRVRPSRNLYHVPQGMMKLASKRLYNFALRHWGNSITTDIFGPVMELADPKNLPADPAVTGDLALHPGDPRYAHETQWLMQADRKTVMNGHKFISYWDLT